jgi:hypothetical protein
MHRGLVGLALVVVVAAGGCAARAAAHAGPGPGPAATATGDDLVVQVEEVGGFVAPSTIVTRVPTISVYADGRVITAGPQDDIFPGPALPNILVQRISTTDVARLATMARDAGVGTATDTAQMGVADASTTRFTVRVGDDLQTTDIYALDMSDAQMMTGAQRAVRLALKALVAKLADLPHTLSPDAVSKAEPYRPTAMTAIAWPHDTTDPNAPRQREMDWPGPTLPGVPLNPGMDLHCILVTGTSLTGVLDAAAKANVATPWTSAGRQWTVGFRPLLPDERDCEDLRQNW